VTDRTSARRNHTVFGPSPDLSHYELGLLLHFTACLVLRYSLTHFFTASLFHYITSSLFHFSFFTASLLPLSLIHFSLSRAPPALFNSGFGSSPLPHTWFRGRVFKSAEYLVTALITCNFATLLLLVSFDVAKADRLTGRPAGRQLQSRPSRIARFLVAQCLAAEISCNAVMNFPSRPPSALYIGLRMS